MNALEYAGCYGFARSRCATSADEITAFVAFIRSNPRDAEWGLGKLEEVAARLRSVEVDAEAAVTKTFGEPPLRTWSDHDRNIPIDEQED